MENSSSIATVQTAQVNSISSLWPLGVFIAAMACINCMLGFVELRVRTGAISPSVAFVANFVAPTIGAAQYALAIVLGGLVFRHWIVGVTVSVFVAGFWMCSYLSWQFVVRPPGDTSWDRLPILFSAVCLTPVAVLAGCFPLLLTRIAMCRARPRGNSIFELFAITSYLASVVSVTRLGVMNAAAGEIVFFVVVACLVSALSITPASLLYFTAKDGWQSTLRFVYFTSSLAALLCSLSILVGLISLIPLVGLFLLFTTVLLGLHSMRLSGCCIPNELSSPDALTLPGIRSDQSQLVWVIVSTIAAAFSINVLAAIINMK
jgi:hypothetical protein